VPRQPLSGLESVPVLILAIDTSSKQCSVALLRDSVAVATIGGVTEEPYASRVFGDADGILRQAGVKFAEIDLFAVATGPGSFTGLRVGLTAVKGWSEVFGRPIAAVSALEAVAAQADRPGRLLAPIMDARGGQIFGGLFRSESGRLCAVGEEVVLSFAEYSIWFAEQAGAEEPVFVTTAPELVRTGLAASPFAGATIQEVSSELAPVIGRLGLERSRRGDLVDSLGLEANYVRRSDAEVKWKGG
jgi:tRNA threonylcarbamoyladenosine biosynthesis protein TsaB